MMQIRQARLSDATALTRIAALTGNAGADATPIFHDPSLIAQVWALPYLSVKPSIALVVEENGEVAGYVVGTPDSRKFEANAEQEWWPRLRMRRPPSVMTPEQTGDARYFALFRAPPRAPDVLLADYPAHLHLNILPQTQGRGNGPALAQAWLQQARSLGVTGAHVGVSATNARGLVFWQKQGFSPLNGLNLPDGAIWLGTRL
ncbi:MAG: GNAT family N-acetyltransferase [Deltaproteobacteria bacterium]